jgi:hypothetical protein
MTTKIASSFFREILGIDNAHEHDNEHDGERCGRTGTAHFLHRAGSWDSQYGNWDKGGSSRKIMASIPV